MARIRSIKPQFFLNEDVAALPFQWRLLFIGLWTQADRDGRLEDRPARLKAMLFPYDNLNVNEGLCALASAGLITRYDGDGLRLIAIPTWAKHQQPNVKESQSELPPPLTEKHSASTVPASQEGKGAGREQERTLELRARFERWWTEFPKKVGKDAAWREWLKRSPTAELVELMIAKVLEQRASAQWLKDSGQFIPHPRTWLHRGQWQDEEPAAKPERQIWTCRHLEECSHRAMCEHKNNMPHKYPKRAEAEAS